jgi:malate/lactate dehydrogenase
MKVGIVGAGMGGSVAAYALGLRGVASEVVLVDLDSALAEAHALDIAHDLPFASGMSVTSGDYNRLRDAGIVIIAAGSAQRPGETRTDLLGRNAAIFRDIIVDIMRVCPDVIFLVASKPIDIMTQITQVISGLPARRVIGSGTILDTARFRSLLGAHLHVSPRFIHAYVLGELSAGTVRIGSPVDRRRGPWLASLRSRTRLTLAVVGSTDHSRQSSTISAGVSPRRRGSLTLRKVRTWLSRNNLRSR